MPEKTSPSSLHEMLDRFEEAADEKKTVSVDQLMDAVGRRSFGPLILLAGIVLSAPGVGDIPGVASIIGIYILLVAGQLLAGRDTFWLPEWLLRRSAKSETVKKAAASEWMRRPARVVDKLVNKRLTALVGKQGTVAVAIACCILAFATPMTEVVPFSGTAVGTAVGVYGIALIAQDGLMAIVGFAIAACTICLAIIGTM